GVQTCALPISNQQYQKRNWQSYFAKSEIPVYQEYFLKHLEPTEATKYKEEIINLLFAQDDFIPHYAIDVLEADVLKDPNQYNSILKQLDRMKPHVITEIINSISAANEETKSILTAFRATEKASPKQKELIAKFLNYEKQ